VQDAGHEAAHVADRPPRDGTEQLNVMVRAESPTSRGADPFLTLPTPAFVQVSKLPWHLERRDVRRLIESADAGDVAFMQNVNKPRGGGSVFDDEQTAFVRLKRVGSADAAMARLRDAGLEATRMTELDMVTRTMVGRHPSPKRNLVVHGGLPWQ